MFVRELLPVLGPGAALGIIGSMAQTFTAAGTTQATATAITTVYTFVSTATEGQGALLPDGMGASDQLTVCNGTSVDIYVYPPTSDRLNGGTLNAPFCIAPNRAVEFTYVGDGVNWMAR